MRLLLNVTSMQTGLACMLVKHLPDTQEVQTSEDAESMPQLILGSLRW